MTGGGLVTRVAAAVRRLVPAAPGERRQTVRLAWREPPHPDRETDPGYALFRRRRAALRRAGRLVCDRCGAVERVELHHRIPYALRGGLDPARVERRYGVALTDAWFHGAGNTVPLCDACHTLIHAIPGPAWAALEVWRADLPPPVRVVSAQGDG